MTKKEKAMSELKKGLAKFKADALSKGWEEDEIQEKITEVYENFPWYKYNPPKKSWKSKVFNFLLFGFISYLAVTAVLERNRRWKKKLDDYLFDAQITYHTQRVIRILTLPIFKFYDISTLHESECLISNPFKPPEELDCSFCEGIDQIAPMSVNSKDVPDMIKQFEPVVLTDVPNYFDKKITFDDFKMMFQQNKEELDEAVCNIKYSEKFTKMSDFFNELTEDTVNEKNISVAWSNCHTYGTRFYRKLFPRPQFVAKESEIHFEKRVFILQKNTSNVQISGNNEGKSFYIHQVQGESAFELGIDSSCHYNCSSEPLKTNLKAGEVGVFPNSGWALSFTALGDGLNIIFVSSFT